ncbi:MAG: hypothetical protein AB7F40_02420 [Victivallaceae bacterium]|nr:hypothetical protein [Victivallaceae bacterium]
MAGKPGKSLSFGQIVGILLTFLVLLFVAGYFIVAPILRRQGIDPAKGMDTVRDIASEKLSAAGDALHAAANKVNDSAVQAKDEAQEAIPDESDFSGANAEAEFSKE